MFFPDRETRELRARVKELEEDLFSAEESATAWHQKAATAEHRMSVMELHRSADGLAKIVLALAEDIENIVVCGGTGRKGRLDQIASVVRRGIEMALLGEKGWQT